eukprot:11397-Heterococcus_DN1.PRE.5
MHLRVQCSVQRFERALCRRVAAFSQQRRFNTPRLYDTAYMLSTWCITHPNRWLALDQRPTVQVDALWALTNIAAGTPEHTHVLIKHGAIPALVKLLVHSAATSSNTAVDSSSSDSTDGGATAGSTAIVVASEQQRDGASVIIRCVKHDSTSSLLKSVSHTYIQMAVHTSNSCIVYAANMYTLLLT